LKPEKQYLQYLLCIILFMIFTVILLPVKAFAEGELIDLSGTAEISVSQENGQTVAVATVAEEKLLNTVGQNPMAVKMVLALNNSESVVRVRLTAYTLMALSGYGIPFEIKAPGGSFTIPGSGIDMSNAVLKLGVEPEFYDFVIARPTGQKMSAVDSYIRANGLTALSQAVEFRVDAVAGEKAVSVDIFQSYCEKGIRVNSYLDESTAVGVVLDSGNKLTPVPTQFITENGLKVAKIKDIKNGIYTVISHRQVFADMTGHWAKNDVNMLASKLIVSGLSEQKFGPEKKTTRAQYITMVIKALGLNTVSGSSGFRDVKAGDWFAGAVLTAVKNGLTGGYDDGRFKPNNLITREEIAVLAVKALVLVKGEPLANKAEIEYYLRNFKDKEKISPWAQTYIATAVRNSIITGDSSGLVNPGVYATRAEAVVMLKKMMLKAGFISPTFTITSPVDNTKTNQAYLTITGTSDEGSSVTVNSIPVYTDLSGSFSMPLDLMPGINTITIVVTDSSGNVNTIYRTVIFDESVPTVLSIELFDVPENLVTGRTPFAFKGKVEPGSTVTVNGMKVNPDSYGNFSFSIPLNNGKNLINIVAISSTGSETSLSRTIIYDKNPPSLTVLTPTDNFKTDNNILIVTGYTEPGCKVQINDREAQVDSKGNFSYIVDLQTVGTDIKVTAADQNGNVFTVTRKVVLDTVSLSNLVLPEKIRIGTRVPIKYNLNLDGYVTVRIYKDGTKLVRTLLDNGIRKKGDNQEFWDGRDDSKALVPEGTYDVVIKAKGTGKADISQQSKTVSAFRVPSILSVKVNLKVIDPATGQNAIVKFNITENCLLTVKIMQGKTTVKTVVYAEPRSKGTQEVRWDGKDGSGGMISDSLYSCVIEVVNPKEPSYKTVTKTNIFTESQIPKVSFTKTPDIMVIGNNNIFRYSLTEKAKVSIQVYDSNSGAVHSLTKDLPRNAGINSISWTGKTGSNVMINEGRYTLSITARDNSGKTSGTLTYSFAAYFLPKISKMSAAPISFKPGPAVSSITFSFNVSSKALVTLKINRGRLTVKNVVYSKLEQPGVKSFKWDGRDTQGKIVASGNYIYQITVVNPGYPAFSSNSRGMFKVMNPASVVNIRTKELNFEKMAVSTHNINKYRPEMFSPTQANTLGISKISVTPNPFNPLGDGMTWISYTLQGEALVSAAVYSGNRMIKSLVNNEYQWFGEQYYDWDGLDKRGNIVDDGTYILRIELTDPMNPERKKLYQKNIIVDSGAPVVTDLVLSPASLRLYGGEPLTIKFGINEQSKVNVEILQGDRLVKTAVKNRLIKAGTCSFTWDGRDDSGDYVMPGTYTVNVTATDAYNNKGSASAGIVVKPHLEVSSSEPGDGYSGVKVNADIVITFNANLSKSGAFNDISLKADTNTVLCETKLAGNKLTINPINELLYGTQFTVRIPADAVKDFKGYILPGEYVTRFTTEGAPRTSGYSDRINLYDAMVSTVSVSGNTSVFTVSLNETQVTALLNNNAGARLAILPMSLNTDTINIRISAGLMNTLTSKNVSLEVYTPKVSLIIPAGAVDWESLSRQPGMSSSGTIYNVVIKFPSQWDDTNTKKIIKKYGMSPLASPVTLELEVLSGEQKFYIKKFNRYLLLAYHLFEPVNQNCIVGIRLDGKGSLAAIPARCKSENGNIALVSTMSSGTFCVGQSQKTFSDLSGHWAKKNIETLASKLVLGGVTQTAFAPDRTVTRAEFVTMIVKALGIENSTTKTSFKDIKAGSWYFSTVMAAVGSGIASGYEDRTFRPLAGISREEAAILGVRALEIAGIRMNLTEANTSLVLSKFIDNKKISPWSKIYAAKAVKTGLVSGYGNGFFVPGNYITRAEAAAVLMKILLSAGLA
jgi:flagellar hook assembly protein FlgD